MIDASVWLHSVEAVGRRALVRPSERGVLAAMLFAYPALEGAIRAGRALDHVVAPGHRRVPIVEPWFVLGHQRSGTTFLHRLLALDPRFKAPKAWELLLPAVSLHRTARTLVGIPGARTVAKQLEQRLFGDNEPWHTTRWELPEEDDWLFLHAAMSPTIDLLTAQPSITARYQLGDDLPEAERDRAMRWYVRSLRRILASAPEATLLSKSPFFLGWLRSLDTTFPDARFVMIVRDPSEAIASWLAMATGAWGPIEPVLSRKDPRIEQLFQASIARYRHAEDVWSTIPDERKLRVRYDELVLDPVATVERVYQHYDVPLEPIRPALTDAAEQARRRVPTPRHHLRHFGIRPQRVAEELGDLEWL